MAFRPNFVANLSTMFNDVDFCDRFTSAKNLGFDAVEAQSLYHVDLNRLSDTKKKTGLKLVLLNSPSSGMVDYFDGKAFGLACIPGQEVEFQKTVLKAVQYATTLCCNKIHVLAGLKQDDFLEEDMMNTYKANMQAAAEICEEHNIMCLIEPICFQVKEKYFMDSFEKAVEVISESNQSNLKLLLDIYHLYMLEQDVENGIKKYLKYAGHVQISQAPGRQEPFHCGKIKYDEVFKQLTEMKYNGHIGLEYTPSDPEKASTWLDRFRLN